MKQQRTALTRERYEAEARKIQIEIDAGHFVAPEEIADRLQVPLRFVLHAMASAAADLYEQGQVARTIN